MPLGLLAAPLIASLGGLALTAAAKPQYDNYAARTRGRYAEGLLQDVNRDDPDAVAGALFGGGLLDAPQYQGDLRTGYEGQMGRDAAMARQRVSSGPAYMQAQLAQAKWAEEQRRWQNDPLNPDSPNYMNGLTPYQAAQIEIQQQNADSTRMNADTATNRLQLEKDAIEAERARQIVTQQEEFIGQMQPLVNQQQMVDYAIANLDEASFDRQFWSSQEGINTRQSLNQLIFAQRQQFIKETYGENEPPPSVQEQVAEMFPLIEREGLFAREGQQRALVMQNLMRLRQDLINQRQTLEGSMTRGGIAVPQVPPQNVLPGGWEPVQ